MAREFLTNFKKKKKKISNLFLCNDKIYLIILFLEQYIASYNLYPRWIVGSALGRLCLRRVAKVHKSAYDSFQELFFVADRLIFDCLDGMSTYTQLRMLFFNSSLFPFNPYFIFCRDKTRNKELLHLKY